MSIFPSVLSTFNRPSTTSRLDNPSHSALHNTVSSAVGQIEAVIGRNGDNSVAGTLTYQIQSPDSNGGGHVQTANKGGTGQTTFTKGDILVATSTSVLAKLAVGIDGQVFSSNSSTASGVQWINNSAPKVAVSGSVRTIVNPQNETSIFSVSIPASTLGTNNAIRSTVYVDRFDIASGDNIVIRARYGVNLVSSIYCGLGSPTTSLMGKIEHVLFATNTLTTQGGELLIDLRGKNLF